LCDGSDLTKQPARGEISFSLIEEETKRQAGMKTLPQNSFSPFSNVMPSLFW